MMQARGNNLNGGLNDLADQLKGNNKLSLLKMFVVNPLF
jgi:hypothetical protein